MGKIKGWKKEKTYNPDIIASWVNTIYDNPRRNLHISVEKYLNFYDVWIATNPVGGSGSFIKKIGKYTTKEEAIKKARSFMKFHSDDTGELSFGEIDARIREDYGR